MTHRCSSFRLGCAAALITLLPTLIKDGASAQVSPKVQVVTAIGHSQSVYSVAFSPDGARLVSGSADNTIKLWEVQSGRLLRTLVGHTGTVRHLLFHQTVPGCSRAVMIGLSSCGKQRPGGCFAPWRDIQI